MLSRVADSLYWLSRYIERAENLSRLVEVSRHLALDQHVVDESHSVWRPVLYATSAEELYAATKEKNDQLDVGRFITFSPENPDSIRNCIAAARENARMVRDQISEEMWLELNSIHLFLRSGAAERLFQSDPHSLFRRVIHFSLLFQGLIDATILHDEGWQFTNLGKFIERADKTSRILDTLTFRKATPERQELISVLRSCSGFSAFRAEYLGDVSLQNVASFLLFSLAFPRSIRFCLRRLDETLHSISGVAPGAFSNEAERLTGGALARINFTEMDEVWQRGLHETVDDFQSHLNDIGQALFENYVLLPFEIDSVARAEVSPLKWSSLQQQQQQQQ